MARLLPAHWVLPVVARLDQCQGIEPESRFLTQIGPGKGVALDVGANYGLYTWALSKLYRKVVAFEPNHEAASQILAARLPNVEVIFAGVSSANGIATLFIPRVNGVVLSGWASLDYRNCPDATVLVKQEVELRTLDSQRFEDVGFIKIDVEGHEIEVLRGGAKTIQRHHPHLLIEIREKHLAETRHLLTAWDYHEVRLKSLCGISGSPQNYVFLPNRNRLGASSG